ncbi:MAG TPA: disulfide bond formation protein B [Stellaceae bacterium]|nr:disulfide bond formation protein B [Stellaceae bacterium]
MSLLILLSSMALIAGALAFQYIGGLSPCELCLAERWPYYVAIFVSAVVVALRRPAIERVARGFFALLFLASAGLAFYHVGVEQHWFAGPTACTASGAGATTLEALKAQLMAQPVVRCDVPQWTLVGVSLAGWNLVASLVLAALALLLAPGRRRFPQTAAS